MKKVISVLNWFAVSFGVLFVILLVVAGIMDSVAFFELGFASLTIALAFVMLGKTLVQKSFRAGFPISAMVLMFANTAGVMIYMACGNLFGCYVPSEIGMWLISAWCIFSLVYLIVAAILYQYDEKQADKKEEAIAKKALENQTTEEDVEL